MQRQLKALVGNTFLISALIYLVRTHRSSYAAGSRSKSYRRRATKHKPRLQVISLEMEQPNSDKTLKTKSYRI